MAGGVSVPTTPAGRTYARAKFTPYTALVCLIAAFGGALFGYDIGRREGRGREGPGRGRTVCRALAHWPGARALRADAPPGVWMRGPPPLCGLEGMGGGGVCRAGAPPRCALLPHLRHAGHPTSFGRPQFVGDGVVGRRGLCGARPLSLSGMT